jgi:hypothetical protein
MKVRLNNRSVVQKIGNARVIKSYDINLLYEYSFDEFEWIRKKKLLILNIIYFKNAELVELSYISVLIMKIYCNSV